MCIRDSSYNKAAARVKMINAASEDTFGFDCVCLIKGILWGWNGDKNATYGGAKYASNNVPDLGADSMIKKCPDASTTCLLYTSYITHHARSVRLITSECPFRGGRISNDVPGSFSP